jgi:L-asparaginase II
MTAPDGTTVALKMLDGSNRAAHAVALRLLERAGALEAGQVADALSALPLTVLGGGQQVGVIRAAL